MILSFLSSHYLCCSVTSLSVTRCHQHGFVLRLLRKPSVLWDPLSPKTWRRHPTLSPSSKKPSRAPTPAQDDQPVLCTFTTVLLGSDPNHNRNSFQWTVQTADSGLIHLQSQETQTSPCWWKVGWSFVVCKSFLELHSKTVLQHSPDQLKNFKNNSSKNPVWLHTVCLAYSKCLETLRSQIDREMYHIFVSRAGECYEAVLLWSRKNVFCELSISNNWTWMLFRVNLTFKSAIQCQ